MISSESIDYTQIIRNQGFEELLQLEKDCFYPPNYSMRFKRIEGEVNVLDIIEIELVGTKGPVMIPIYLVEDEGTYNHYV